MPKGYPLLWFGCGYSLTKGTGTPSWQKHTTQAGYNTPTQQLTLYTYNYIADLRQNYDMYKTVILKRNLINYLAARSTL